MRLPAIWDTMTHMWRHCNDPRNVKLLLCYRICTFAKIVVKSAITLNGGLSLRAILCPSHDKTNLLHINYCSIVTPYGVSELGHLSFSYWFVAWSRHQMETFSALQALWEGNPPVTVGFPHKGQWLGALMFSLICARTNDWATNQYAGDLRRHHIHYNVTVMCLFDAKSQPETISAYC